MHKSMSVVTTLAAVLLTPAHSQEYRPNWQNDEFKGTKQVSVVYDITDEELAQGYAVLRNQDCNANSKMEVTASKYFDKDGESYMLKFIINESVGDSMSYLTPSPLPENPEFIVLADGEQVFNSRGFATGFAKESTYCLSKTWLSKQYGNIYTLQTTLDLKDINLDKLLQAENVKFRIYGSETNYDGVLPKAVRVNIAKLFSETQPK